MSIKNKEDSYLIRDVLIFTGEELIENHFILVENDRIEEIIPLNKISDYSGFMSYTGDGNLLCPGFIDLQVNGAKDQLLNDTPSLECMLHLAEVHRNLGTHFILPTLITDSEIKLKQCIDVFVNRGDEIPPSILGLHLEGPFLSEQKSGVHRKEFLRKFDKSFFKTIENFPKEKILLLSLCPDQIDIESLKELLDLGVFVSIAHSTASPDLCDQFIDLGARSFTHLFNAMSGLSARHPGVIGSALTNDKAWCGIINDTHHVSKHCSILALKSKPKGKVFYVSDSMPALGSLKVEFSLYGETVRVQSNLCLDKKGNLAGANISLRDAVQNGVNFLSLDPLESLRMASLYPAQLIKKENQIGVIKKSALASFNLLDISYLNQDKNTPLDLKLKSIKSLAY